MSMLHIQPHKPEFEWRKRLPFLEWLLHYRREHLIGDMMAGVIVGIMLVPQGMAYALLAGLPPQVGLYASIAPPIIYGLLGTSRTLAVGPVAIDSLLVISVLSKFAVQGTAAYLGMALTLALMVGLIEVAMGLLRVGFLVNFLSQPVLAGFMNAAALMIMISQIKHLLGISLPRSEAVDEILIASAEHLHETNLITLAIAITTILMLWYFKPMMSTLVPHKALPAWLWDALAKLGPMVVVLLGTLLVRLLQLDTRSAVSTVGQVPAGLPSVDLPPLNIEVMQNLLPAALAITLVGYTEAISIAKSMASKRREHLDANQELIALGAANIGAAFTGGYPITGGLSRSMINFNAGANTGLASIITAGVIALTLLVLTPLFTYLPNAVLAAIIVVSVARLFDLAAVAHTWRYNKADFASLVLTFSGGLLLGIERGILIGVLSALALYLYRTSRPHIAIVGRVGNSQHFRNVLRHEVRTCPHVLAVRVDESLYFANAQYLQSSILNCIADVPSVQHFVLVCSAVNFIDASALAALERLIDDLHDAGVNFYMAEIKGPVMDRLQAIGFIEKLGADRVFLSTHEAMETLERR